MSRVIRIVSYFVLLGGLALCLALHFLFFTVCLGLGRIHIIISVEVHAKLRAILYASCP